VADASPEIVDPEIQSLLATQRDAQQRRSQDLQREFTTLALSGQGLPAIVEHLARVTGFPAAWEDRALELRTWALPPNGNPSGGAALGSPGPFGALGTAASAFSQTAGEIADVPAVLLAARRPLLRWSCSLSPSAHAEVVSLPLHEDDPGRRAPWHRLVVPVTTGNEINGYLSVIARNGAAEQDARLALAEACLAASIEVLRLRTVKETQATGSSAILRDWLTGRIASHEDATASLTQLGYVVSAPFVVAVIEWDVEPQLEKAERRLSPALLAVTLAPASEMPPLTAQLDERRLAVLISQVDTHRLASTVETLNDHPRPLDPASGVAAVTDGVRAGTVCAGIGRAVEGTAVPRSYREALRALTVIRRLASIDESLPRTSLPSGAALRISSPRVWAAFFGTLGIYRLLAAVSPQDELRDFAHDVLGPLIAHDRRSGSDLLRTLEIYVSTGGSPQETAEQLHTHRNTVLYRIDRIAKLLGVDMRDAQQRLALHLACRAIALLPTETELGPTPPPAPSALSA
jgi:hypothetical protein